MTERDFCTWVTKENSYAEKQKGNHEHPRRSGDRSVDKASTPALRKLPSTGRCDFNDAMWSDDCLYVNIPPLAPISPSVHISTQLLCEEDFVQYEESLPVLPVIDDLRGTRGEKRSDISAVSMDIQQERRRLLDEEDGHDPTGLISEQDAYLRLVQTLNMNWYQQTGNTSNCIQLVQQT